MKRKHARPTEKRVERLLAKLLDRYAMCRSYEDAGVLTNNKGLVVMFPNSGAEFQITIVQSRRGR